MNLDSIISRLTAHPQHFVKAIISKSWSMRLIQKQGVFLCQITERRGNQEFHQNLQPKEAWALFTEQLSQVKQAYIYTTEADYQILQNKGNQKILSKSSSKTANLMHNRAKNYLIPENEPVPFLIELEIMSKEGKIYPKKRDKFIQINRFLEVISQIQLPEAFTVADLGCGKAYLTFALYDYFVNVLHKKVTLYGCDLKKEVMENCRQLARKLNYEQLFFETSSIQDFNPPTKIDMVIALHACNTATDQALLQALRWESGVILVAPCCQHELRPQIQSEPLTPLMKHGILKENFSALVTDAARAQFLEAKGYRVDAIEFVDPEHTPKNILIRAVKDANVDKQKALKVYQKFREFLAFNSLLDRSMF